MKADMREKIKYLEKENQMLKQELENKFDKDRLIIQTKLSDEVREKKKLAESNELMQERLLKLEDRLTQAASNGTPDLKLQQQKIEEMQAELSEII